MALPNYGEIDSLLKLLDREIWIVTAAVGNRRGGLTATWVSSASIDRERPVLLAGLAPNHHTAELARASGGFTAHLIAPDQVELAFQFASRSGYDADKFANVASRPGTTASPILTDCVAWFECRVFARHDAGDRWFFWGDVIDAGSVQAGPVLRERAFFNALTAEQRQQLSDGVQKDLRIQRPMHEAWRDALRAGTPVAPSKTKPGK